MNPAAPGAAELVATVAHELRSPLNGIKTWAHVLENQLPQADATARRAIAGIMTCVDQQVRLIEDLEAAHAGAAQADSERIRHSLARLAADAARVTASGGTIGIDASAGGASARITVTSDGAAFEVLLPLR